MRTLTGFLFLALPCLGAYQYYYSDAFSSLDTTKWQQNGVISLASPGITSADANGGSLISKVAVPDGTARYEVRSIVNLAVSGGTYIQYLRASQDALSGPVSSGTYYAFEIQNPVFTADGRCTATIVGYKRQSGIVSALSTVSLGCSNRMVMRAVYIGSYARLYVNDRLFMFLHDNAIMDGKAGVGVRGVPAGNTMTTTDLGPLDTVAPSPIDRQTLGASAFSDHVEFQWRAPADDANGIGVSAYSVYRDGNLIFTDYAATGVDDGSVAPATTYSYRIDTTDFHGNVAGYTISVATPSTWTIDPRRMGVRPTGAYWGGGGEQIDVRSGNLNYSIPLLKAAGRNGAGATLMLSYNSQFWRKDTNGTWKLGRDLGYGLGWRLMAGSLTPVYSGWWTLHHFVYTDATGAEYRLNVSENGIWRSTEGVYVYYDPLSQRLFFTDGSYWVMGATVAGEEDDAGTLYPTEIRDSNGNQVLIRYNPGIGAATDSSSARIKEIEDVRATMYWDNGQQKYRTFGFSYTNEARPHLTNVTNYIGTAENYTFSPSPHTLYDPFDHQPYGQISMLGAITNGLGQTTGFVHDASSGEMTLLQLPEGGCVGWNHANLNQASILIRQVGARYVSPGNCTGGFTWHHLYIDTTAPSAIPMWGVVRDDTANSEKVWWFDQTNPSNFGLLTAYQERSYPASVVSLTKEFTWARSSSTQPYISTAITRLDPGQSYGVSSKTTQTVDFHGNVTETKMFGYGNSSSVADRTYTTTYLGYSPSEAGYKSRFVLNRPLTVTLNAGGQNYSLATNVYDATLPSDVTGLREHATSEYGQYYSCRGNLTSATTLGGTRTITYDITGRPTSASGAGMPSMQMTAAAGTNDAAPGAITPNGVSNMASSYSWTGFLGLSTYSAPNQYGGSISYDGTGRPQSSVSPTGATATYVYTTTTVKATTNGRWTLTTTDGLGRTIKVEAGDATSTKTVVETEYAPC
ncbi:MAG: hypothetical protein NTY38_17410, partial [Acidobacteria bacterium]|nr:hypothetical protein [Acidobacteriota bacterium]